MKLLILKKSFIFILAAVVAAGIIIGVVAGTVQASTDDRQKTVVIDAGHGGIDAGVRGIKTSVKESEINLSISKYLRGYFSDAGFKTVMTRTGNGGLYGTSTKGFKMRDMKKRKEIITDCNADMVISVHQNFCPIASKRGAHAFFDKDSECGKALAQAVQDSINEMEDCVETNTPLAGDYYMLKCTQNPSIIVECGFLSNPDDETLLCDTEFQKKIAYAIFKGAVSYFG